MFRRPDEIGTPEPDMRGIVGLFTQALKTSNGGVKDGIWIQAKGVPQVRGRHV